MNMRLIHEKSWLGQMNRTRIFWCSDTKKRFLCFEHSEQKYFSNGFGVQYNSTTDNIEIQFVCLDCSKEYAWRNKLLIKKLKAMLNPIELLELEDQL